MMHRDTASRLAAKLPRGVERRIAYDTLVQWCGHYTDRHTWVKIDGPIDRHLDAYYAALTL